MAYQDPRQYIDVYPPRLEQQAPPYRTLNIIVQVPKAPTDEFLNGSRGAYRGTARPSSASLNSAVHSKNSSIRPTPQHNPGAIPPTSRSGTTNNHTLNNVKKVPFAKSPPATTSVSAPAPPIDYQLLLLSLAEDYFATAHGKGSLVASHCRKDDLNQYYKLIATGLGCLEAVLKVGQLSLSTIAIDS